MGIDLLRDRGVPLDRQTFTWRELMHPPCGKLDADAFTRMRAVAMCALEVEAGRFGHACGRNDRGLRAELARVRRIEQHQETLLRQLVPANQTPLESAIAHEQTAIELTAALAASEPDAYVAQVYRFALLEDLDHLYRFAALLDRVEGRDANTLLQSHTDILPGRPSALAHSHPDDDLRDPYRRDQAALTTKLGAYTAVALKTHSRGFYLAVGASYPDPLGRQLFAELASIEEQHLTQLESLLDPEESWLERWLLHEASEVVGYESCLAAETDPRVRPVWERFLGYELGQLQHVAGLLAEHEQRDPAELLDGLAPRVNPWVSHREYIRGVLRSEVHLTASGHQLIPRADDPPDSASRRYRDGVHRDGVASERVAAGYVWSPGTELARQLPSIHRLANA
ncbi:MAG: hypothetical protein ABW252_08160 [Polyangiales bacterium]